MSSNQSVYHKLQRGTVRLNADAYTQQVREHKQKGRKGKLKHFTPCAKSVTLIEEGKKVNPLLLPAVIRACSEICSCHVGLHVEELLGFCLEIYSLVDKVK